MNTTERKMNWWIKQCPILPEVKMIERESDGEDNMNPTERELIRSKLHQVDLLLRKVDRKARAMIEQGGEIQWLVRQIEELKKPVYELLDRKGGG